MPVTSKSATPAQRDWLEQYERETTAAGGRSAAEW